MNEQEIIDKMIEMDKRILELENKILCLEEQKENKSEYTKEEINRWMG